MSGKKEASGRRSVQVEVEVPGTPEEVWQAIATGPGISSWFVPAEFEDRDGEPWAVQTTFGPGSEARAGVTAWEPPRSDAGRGGRGVRREGERDHRAEWVRRQGLPGGRDGWAKGGARTSAGSPGDYE